MPAPATHGGRSGEVGRLFLRLGLTTIGGGHIAVLRDGSCWLVLAGPQRGLLQLALGLSRDVAGG
jgi:hypothetical protein